MSKPSRPASPDSIKAHARTFFVTTRAAEGKAILQSDRMADLFADVLRSYTRQEKFKVHDFVVMRNHVHLLITVNRSMSIEKAMQLIKAISHFGRERNSASAMRFGNADSPMYVFATKKAFANTSGTSTTTP